MVGESVTFMQVDDAGNEVPVKVSAHYEVCPTCQGKGSHVNRAIDGHGMTYDEMYDAGTEFVEDYLGGTYDVPCEECKGLRVVLVANEDDPNYAAYREDRQAEAEYQAQLAYERRMGY